MFEEWSVAEVLELEFEQQAFEAVDSEPVLCSKIVPNSQIERVVVVEELVVEKSVVVVEKSVLVVEVLAAKAESMEQLTASVRQVETVVDSTETEHLN